MKEKHTDTWCEYLALIGKVHKVAESAARETKTDRLLESTDWLRRAKELEAKYNQLLQQADRLMLEWYKPDNNKADNTTGRHAINDSTITTSEDSDGKARAKEFREAYVLREINRGNILNKDHGIYYKNSTGLSVGITYSKQDKEKSCPWFLNLLERQFEDAILLCEISTNAVKVVHLPKTFFDRYGKQISRGKGNAIKFNILTDNERFFLQIRNPQGRIDITEYTEEGSLLI